MLSFYLLNFWFKENKIKKQLKLKIEHNYEASGDLTKFGASLVKSQQTLPRIGYVREGDLQY